MTRVLTLVLTAALLASGAVACGGDDEGDAQRVSAQTTPVTDELVGSWERTVTPADVERTAHFRKLDPGFEATPPGPVRLVIDQTSFALIDLKNNFTVSQRLTASPDGNFDVADYINPQQGAFCGPSIPQGAIYTWSRDGDTLDVKADSDSCADRVSALAGTWRHADS